MSLLSGTPSAGALRYVVGPAALNQTSIQSARAELFNGEWVIQLRMTPEASTQLDLLTYHTFHSMIGFDLNGRIIEAPITLGGQTHWSSFEGQIQITGNFTENQAKALAAEL
jgi:preprotein translocase subunit SecD